MKVKAFIIVGLSYFVFAVNTNAQTPQVNNSGFENWENVGSDTEEPLEWNSFKTAQGSYSSLGAKQVMRSTQKRPGSNGNYSAVIWCRDAILAIANGNLTTGRINMGSTNPSSTSNYNITLTSNSAFHETLNAMPDSLVVWVRSKIANQSHQPRIHAVIHDNYDLRDPIDANSAPHVVGEATLNFPTTNNQWVRKSIPFVYNGPATSPNYILISFSTCKDPGVGTGGDSLYIDDLMLIYNPTLTTGTISNTTYVVDANNGANISVPFTLTGTMYPNNVVYAQLSDASGSFSSPIILGSLNTTTSGVINGYIPAGTPTGTGYRVRVVSTNYALTAADNGTDIVITNITGIQHPQAETVDVFFVDNTLTVKMKDIASNSLFRLYNLNGGLIAEFPIKTAEGNHFTVNIPAGLYIYSIVSTENIVNGKILKQ